MRAHKVQRCATLLTHLGLARGEGHAAVLGEARRSGTQAGQQHDRGDQHGCEKLCMSGCKLLDAAMEDLYSDIVQAHGAAGIARAEELDQVATRACVGV